ncbi:RNA 2',3'-cyclic phosphodiesterase [Dyella caseinilytica]|uniref:RNA 2',3'-cyclic phosphodiesterase n=1 Tax=Dyella caseinilytica TaxID=1849581 RepID=A0ABX7GPZ4_9GAMM|nr:RNA 2',3'-cyclic phosphodiesterase [Dyella caseinilytica]QRN52492.1 RNA 2',3'-cyclic phosphodiesterase [Dyella caseinilytica]GGA06472.1 RNA 2',3'-cyclic phosphodiesterase [Dyella caseinilytica]
MHANPPAAQHSLLRSVPKARAETHRLFFALMPEGGVRQRLHRLAGWLQDQHPELRARWGKPERFHATLNFLGDYPVLPDEAIERASAAANGLHASSFDWSLDYAASFRGREPPCVMRCTTVPPLLLALWQDLGVALVQAGLHRRAERQYTPHVTLAYARCELPEPVPVEPIAWHVDQFVLIHNVVGKGNYQILGHWFLSA